MVGRHGRSVLRKAAASFLRCEGSGNLLNVRAYGIAKHSIMPAFVPCRTLTCWFNNAGMGSSLDNLVDAKDNIEGTV